MKRIEAVRLVRYGTRRWTVHVIYTDRSSHESEKMTYQKAASMASQYRAQRAAQPSVDLESVAFETLKRLNDISARN